MIIIEFFGPPCSGKSFYSDYIYKKKKNNIIRSNALILKFANKFLKLNALEKLSIRYIWLLKYIKGRLIITSKINKKSRIQIKKKKIKYLKRNNLSKTLLENYRKVCKKLFYLYKVKNFKFVTFCLDQLKLIKDKERRNNYRYWLEENIARYYIAQNIEEKKIVIFDEGFIQRSSFLIKNKKFSKNKLKKYLYLMSKPDYAIYLDNNLNTMMNRSKHRDSKNSREFIYDNINELKSFKLFFKYIYKNISKND